MYPLIWPLVSNTYNSHGAFYQFRKSERVKIKLNRANVYSLFQSNDIQPRKNNNNSLIEPKER